MQMVLDFWSTTADDSPRLDFGAEVQSPSKERKPTNMRWTHGALTYLANCRVPGILDTLVSAQAEARRSGRDFVLLFDVLTVLNDDERDASLAAEEMTDLREELRAQFEVNNILRRANEELQQRQTRFRAAPPEPQETTQARFTDVEIERLSELLRTLGAIINTNRHAANA